MPNVLHLPTLLRASELCIVWNIQWNDHTMYVSIHRTVGNPCTIILIDKSAFS